MIFKSKIKKNDPSLPLIIVTYISQNYPSMSIYFLRLFFFIFFCAAQKPVGYPKKMILALGSETKTHIFLQTIPWDKQTMLNMAARKELGRLHSLISVVDFD